MAAKKLRYRCCYCHKIVSFNDKMGNLFRHGYKKGCPHNFELLPIIAIKERGVMICYLNLKDKTRGIYEELTPRAAERIVKDGEE